MKIVVLGDPDVGKTSFISRYATGNFHEDFRCNIGIDFRIREHHFNGCNYKIVLWDTAGAERFKALSRAYYRGADGLLLFYSVDDRVECCFLGSILQQKEKIKPK